MAVIHFIKTAPLLSKVGSIRSVLWTVDSETKSSNFQLLGLCGDELSNGMSMDSSLYTAEKNDDDYIDNLKKDKSKLELGQHESWLNYHNCPSEPDNKKHGYECNAERKFYPYHFSPFFDIAHLSNQVWDKFFTAFFSTDSTEKGFQTDASEPTL